MAVVQPTTTSVMTQPPQARKNNSLLTPWQPSNSPTATVAVGLFEGVGGVNVKLFAKTCFGWIITLVVVGCTTAMLVGPSPEPLKGEYCDNYAEVKYN